MSINPVSGNAQQPLASAATGTTAPVAQPQSASQQSTTVAAPKHDSVKLTGAALAKSLKLGGMTPKQIAQKMGLDLKTVDSYLGVNATTTTVAVTPVAKTAVPAASAASQTPSAAEEATESGAEKAAEAAQGAK